MDSVLDAVEISGCHLSICIKVRLYQVEDLGTESMFHRSSTAILKNVAVRWMTLLERSGKKLGRKEFKMVFYRKLQSLVVEVFEGRRFVATQSQTQGAVLDELQAANGRGGIIRIYYWSGVVGD